MFPYRDENQTQRTPIVNYLLIALNVIVWLFVEGAGSPMALARAVCDPRADPGRAHGGLGAGHPIPDGRRARLPHRPRPTDLARLHLDVPARLVDAPDR
jgi:hypothetical protein